MTTSVEAVYLSATLLQIGATIVFIFCAKLLGLNRVNAFTIAFGLIAIRRILVLFLNDLLPLKVQEGILYADMFLLPIVFSLLLFIGTVQFYVKLRKYFIVIHK